MGIYQNGYKRPKTYKVTVTDEFNVVTEHNYSVLSSFSSYNSITEQQYLLLSPTMAKQRMTDFINYIHATNYSGVVVDFNNTTLTPFDIQDETTCPVTIPEPQEPPSVEQQTVNLSSEIISQTSSTATVRWVASISGGTAMQNILVPVIITNNGNGDILYQTISIPINTTNGYIELTYVKEPISYVVDCDINISGTHIDFILGVYHTEELIPNIIIDPVFYTYSEEIVSGGVKSIVTVTGSSNTNYKFQMMVLSVSNEFTDNTIDYRLYNGSETVLIQSGTWNSLGDYRDIPFQTDSSGVFTFVYYNEPQSLPEPYVDNCAEISFVLYRANNQDLNYSEHEDNYGCSSYSPVP